MAIKEVKPGVIAVDRPGYPSNVGMVRTTEGVVVIDTTSKPTDMQEALDTTGIMTPDVCLVIITHADSDHTGGNKLFDCPILAHRLCRQRMVKKRKPKRELPTETFEEKHEVESVVSSLNFTILAGTRQIHQWSGCRRRKCSLPEIWLFRGVTPLFTVARSLKVSLNGLKPSSGCPHWGRM